MYDPSRALVDIEAKVKPEFKRISKQHASVFDGTDLADLVKENNIDTITLTGFMTNNCVLGTAEGAEPHGVTAEVLADATGAIHIANEAGKVSAQQIHKTIMTMLNSNFAAVTTTDAWTTAIKDGAARPTAVLLHHHFRVLTCCPGDILCSSLSDRNRTGNLL